MKTLTEVLSAFRYAMLLCLMHSSRFERNHSNSGFYFETILSFVYSWGLFCYELSSSSILASPRGILDIPLATSFFVVEKSTNCSLAFVIPKMGRLFLAIAIYAVFSTSIIWSKLNRPNNFTKWNDYLLPAHEPIVIIFLHVYHELLRVLIQWLSEAC